METIRYKVFNSFEYDVDNKKQMAITCIAVLDGWLLYVLLSIPRTRLPCSLSLRHCNLIPHGDIDTRVLIQGYNWISKHRVWSWIPTAPWALELPEIVRLVGVFWTACHKGCVQQKSGRESLNATVSEYLTVNSFIE